MKIMKTFLTAVLLVVTCSVAMAAEADYAFFGGKDVTLDAVQTKLKIKAGNRTELTWTLSEDFIAPLKAVDSTKFTVKNCPLLIEFAKDLYSQLEIAAGNEEDLRGFLQGNRTLKIKIARDMMGTNRGAVDALLEAARGGARDIKEPQILKKKAEREIADLTRQIEVAKAAPKLTAEQSIGGHIVTALMKNAGSLAPIKGSAAFKTAGFKLDKTLLDQEPTKVASAFIDAFKELSKKASVQATTIAELNSQVAVRGQVPPSSSHGVQTRGIGGSSTPSSSFGKAVPSAAKQPSFSSASSFAAPTSFAAKAPSASATFGSASKDGDSDDGAGFGLFDLD